MLFWVLYRHRMKQQSLQLQFPLQILISHNTKQTV